MHDDFTAVSLSHATTIAVAQCCVVYETGVHYRQGFRFKSWFRD
jgi:hypothetical protein